MPHAPFPVRRVPTVVALAALVLGAAPTLAWAQATAEQQQACAPDAIKLCSDTIPDIPKTTACMKAHVANLSPRCRIAFNEAVGGAKPPRETAARRAPETLPPRVTARAAERPEVVAPRHHEARTTVLRPRSSRLDRTPTGALPAAAPPAAAALPGLASYEAGLARSCRAGLIDPFTCRNTFDALNLIR